MTDRQPEFEKEPHLLSRLAKWAGQSEFKGGTDLFEEWLMQAFGRYLGDGSSDAFVPFKDMFDRYPLPQAVRLFIEYHGNLLDESEDTNFNKSFLHVRMSKVLQLVLEQATGKYRLFFPSEEVVENRVFEIYAAFYTLNPRQAFIWACDILNESENSNFRKAICPNGIPAAIELHSTLIELSPQNSDFDRFRLKLFRWCLQYSGPADITSTFARCLVPAFRALLHLGERFDLEVAGYGSLNVDEQTASLFLAQFKESGADESQIDELRERLVGGPVDREKEAKKLFEKLLPGNWKGDRHLLQEIEMHLGRGGTPRAQKKIDSLSTSLELILHPVFPDIYSDLGENEVAACKGSEILDSLVRSTDSAFVEPVEDFEPKGLLSDIQPKAAAT